MNEKSFREKVGDALLNHKLAILGAILFVFAVNNLDLFFPAFKDAAIWGIPFALLAIWLISWFKGVGWADLGFRRPESWGKVILVGAIVGIAFQTLAVVQVKFGILVPDLSAFDAVKNNVWKLLGMLVISWTTAGFGEEIIWRGFVMKQFARLFNEEKIGWIIGLVSSTILFGLIHAYQGVNGILTTGLTGLVYGILFLASGRNLWTTIFAHAFTDTLGFLLLYNWDRISPLLGF